MVDLDKQFAAMADVSEEDTAYDFVIDEDLRVIAVPELGVVLGVEGDKDVNRVRFRMNRHYRGTDLSGFNIRINYRSAEDEINYFPVTEKTVTDDAIYFVWLVGADTVAAKGTVYFVARFFTAEEDGTIAQEFNTTLGNARTLEGLVVDAQADDKPVKDLLAQLEYDLKTYTAPFVQQAKTYAENSARSAVSSATSANQAETYANTAQTGAKNAEVSAGKAESAQKKAQELAQEIGAKVHTDPSLTIEGAPADAKATGDMVKGVKFPIATATTLGGIKSGKGLKISADGTASIDAYNTTEIDTMLNAWQEQVDNKISSAKSITASGDGYIRFADGTQICWLKFDGWSRKGYTPYFPFPVPFANTNYGAGFTLGASITYSTNVECYVFDRTTTGLCVYNAYKGSIVVIGRWK